MPMLLTRTLTGLAPGVSELRISELRIVGLGIAGLELWTLGLFDLQSLDLELLIYLGLLNWNPPARTAGFLTLNSRLLELRESLRSAIRN